MSNVVQFPQFKRAGKAEFVVVMGRFRDIDGVPAVPNYYHVKKVTASRIYVKSSERTFFTKHATAYRFFETSTEAQRLVHDLEKRFGISKAIEDYKAAQANMHQSANALLNNSGSWVEPEKQDALI